jgi:hypothetical protein
MFIHGKLEFMNKLNAKCVKYNLHTWVSSLVRKQMNLKIVMTEKYSFVTSDISGN